MIYGIGADLVEMSRIERLLEQYGERFAKRVLTDGEWPAYVNSGKPAMFLAGRFAAKEAFSKAIGTGFRHPVSLGNISVAHDHLGKPYFAFHPALETLIKNEGIIGHHLSISNETTVVCAFVVLETKLEK